MSSNASQPQPAPGWYDDGSGNRRWWDGAQWSAQYVAPPVRLPWNGLGIAGFVVSLVAALSTLYAPVGFIGGLVGGILSVVAFKDTVKRGHGLAIAGMILGLLAMVASITYAITSH